MMDVPEPTIGPNDVLIRMRKTAICGTDMHIWHWDDWAQRTIKPPGDRWNVVSDPLFVMGEVPNRYSCRLLKPS